jgi:molecular chaperone DnaK (HSP70)
VNYASHLTRATFEEFCHDLLERSIVPITNALKAANMTLAEIHGVELIGGGMRVPKVQATSKKLLVIVWNLVCTSIVMKVWH